ncbi:hypothetical protein ACOSQ2_016437 [Xanthoceras sorbifolium]
MAHTPGPPHQLFPLVVCHVTRVVEPLTVRWTVANPTKLQQNEAVKVERLEARPHPNTCPNPPAVAGHLRNQPSQQPVTDAYGDRKPESPSSFAALGFPRLWFFRYRRLR